jgi:hypothetical protein
MALRLRVKPSRSGFARVALACVVMASVPLGASARATLTLDGASLFFFSDTLTLVARGGARFALADGTRASADAAYLDLKTNRVVLAGHARVARGDASANADAVALEIDGDRVDLLDAASGVARTTRALGPASPAEFDAQRFAFPDVDDRYAFIKSRHAAIVPHADVRFSPASFPTSVGGVPVPSYLHTFATGAGFSASSLQGATFDQPYGLWGSENALTALHARWESGPGAALALQQQIVSGDEAYATASIDAPLRGYPFSGFNAYRRLGSRYTLSADASGSRYGAFGHVGLGSGFAGLDYYRSTFGSSSLTASLRTKDRPLFGGATYRVVGSAGFDAQRGGLLGQLPDARKYATVWRHALDLSVAAPTVRIPLGVTLTTTYDVSRTWYSFPHYYDAFSANATATRPLARNLKLFAYYLATWSANVYPNAQGLFYPTPVTPVLLPDGTPYFGYAAFSGASTSRTEIGALQFTPNGSSSYRLTVTHTADFPQFGGYGRPQWEARADVKLRPFPNIGIDVGRAYDFAWGGTRWQPRWSFAITP